VLELSKIRYYEHVLVLFNFFASRALLRSDGGNKDIEVISKMYLVQFINLAKFLVAIHTIMSQKFGFGRCPWSSPWEREGRGRKMNKR